MQREVLPTLPALVAASQQDATEFWQEVADGLQEAVLIVSPDRRIVYGNKSAERLMELDLSQARGRSCSDVISCPQCACRCRLYEEGQVRDLEVTVYVRGSSTPHVFRKNARLLRNAQGEVIGGLETLTDVTAEVSERNEKHARTEQVFREKKRHEALVGSLVEGVFSVNEELELQDFSPQMAEISGYTPAEALGRNLIQLLQLELPRGAVCGQNLTAAPLETEIRRADGSRVAVTISFLPMRYGTEELLGVVRPTRQPPDPATRIETEHGFAGMVGASAVMQKVFELIKTAASTDAAVLIEGESGTGKELVARAIHCLGGQCDHPFFAVNCATFGDSLLLSELFGHERGAFTGAIRTQRGKLELAGGGTLLLDEVGEIPAHHQAVLLRVLEERRFERVGGHAAVELRARVVAATNQDLQHALATGTFRRDLYHRLNVLPIKVPPLRERAGDIQLLTDYFLHRSAQSAGRRPKQLSDEVRAAFERYPWPGNVRELRNLVEYLGLLGDELITIEHVPSYLLQEAPPAEPGPEASPRRPTPAPGDERGRILAALEQTQYRRAKAAELLGMDRSTMWRKMRRYGL